MKTSRKHQNTPLRTRFRELARLAISAGIALVLVAFLNGCASGPTIITNSDPSADFASLRTFDFMQPLSTDNGNVRSLLSAQMIAATTNELEMLGWRRDTNSPDVLINFLLETQQQIRSRPSSASMSMHRSNRYGMWGGTMSTPTIEQTTQGALSIDMIDPVRNQLIWEGTATNRVTDSLRRNQEETVHKFVADIFAQFP
jgi:hypothetical protein